MSDIIKQIISDPSFTQQEKEWVMKFSDEVARRIQTHGVNFGITMFSIADAIGMDLTAVHKEGPFMFSLWVTLLSHFKDHVKQEDMKYPTFEQFRQAYDGWFLEESELELYKLWHVANWMSILFKMITARKNKGLAMQVIPKLVEGWEVKYVTGSGQTKFTANRVHIFEVEGNTKANHRSKAGSKRNRLDGRSRNIQPSKRELAGMMPRRRRRAHHHRHNKPNKGSGDSVSDDELVYVYNNAGSDSDDMDDDDDDSDSVSNEEVNVEMKKVYDSFKKVELQRDETSEMELIRDVSNLKFDVDGNNNSADIPIQREVSWREIPTAYSPMNTTSTFPPNPMLISALNIFPPAYYDNNMGLVYASPMNLGMDVNGPPNNIIPNHALNDIFNGYYVGPTMGPTIENR